MSGVLSEIERGNQCLGYVVPCERYRQRLVSFACQVKLRQDSIDLLNQFSQTSPFTERLHDQLLGQAKRAFSDGDNENGIHICQALKGMRNKQVGCHDRYTLCGLQLRSSGGFVLSNSGLFPQQLELQRARLSPEQARQNRLELCSLYAVLRQNISPFAKSPICLPSGEVSYSEVLAEFDQPKIYKSRLIPLLGLVMPDDLPQVIARLKNRTFSPGDCFTTSQMWWKSVPEETLNDTDLIEAMQYCGRDTVPLLSGFLGNPEAEKALVLRAKRGDISVREKLETFWNLPEPEEEEVEKIPLVLYFENKFNKASPHSPLPTRKMNLLGGLACVGDPEVTADRFWELYKSHSDGNLMNHYTFIENLILLPSPQINGILNNYFAKMENQYPSTEAFASKDFYNELSRFRFAGYDLVGVYGDRDLAELYFQRILAGDQAGFRFEIRQTLPWLDGHSIDLVRKGLIGKDENLRVWSVMTLERLGYEFPAEEIKTLLADPSWKVRQISSSQRKPVQPK